MSKSTPVWGPQSRRGGCARVDISAVSARAASVHCPDVASRSTYLDMGAQVLHAIVCWALLSQASGDQKQLQSVNSSAVKDSAGASSAFYPKLYQNVRIGPYAAPYAAYSFNSPITLSQAFSASAPRPIVQPTVFKDSYGQFVKPQLGYNTQPQQFLQIQALPAHLSQPLAANSAVYQFKAAPNFFSKPEFNLPQGYTVSVAPTTPTDLGQPKVYSESFRSFTPSSSHYTYGASYPTSDVSTPTTSTLPGPSTTTAVKPTENQGSASEIQELPKKQHKYKAYKLTKTNFPNKGAKPHRKETDSQNKQSQTKITAIVNGEPTSVTLDTKPPVPLLDLSLLEPLTFDTPLVTQMQHFLPKIESATYHKLNLPNFNIDGNDENDDENNNSNDEGNDNSNNDDGDGNEEDEDEDDGKKRQHQEIIVEHTNTYDTGVKKVPHQPKKQEPKLPPGSRSPEIVYKINTPNHKEIIKEEVVSYKKETKPDPVHYSYGDDKQGKPKVYSYVHNSQEPLAVTRINYHKENNKPKQFYSSAEQQGQNEESEEQHQNHHRESGESDHSGESSAESDDDDDHQHSSYHQHPDKKHHSQYHMGHDSRGHSHSHSDEDSSGESHSHAALHEKPKKHSHQKEHHEYHKKTRDSRQQDDQRLQKQQSHVPQKSANYQIKPSLAHKPHSNHKLQPDAHQQYHHSSPPRASQYHSNLKLAPKLNYKVEYGKQQINPKQQVTSINPVHLQYYAPQNMKLAMTPTFVPVHPDFHENMRLLKLHKSHAAIKVDPNQYTQYGPTTPRIIRVEHAPVPRPTSKPYLSNPTHVHEKSKKIIIKDESPVELHMHAEQLMQKMIGQEENDEEDFEKGYKQSAFGFPGYDEVEDEIEKEIFNPDSYGVPHEHLEFKIEDNPFEKYQKEGDKFPKSARLSYKDSADNTKEDYYLDYSVSKPESFLDHHKHKVDYYKLYKKQSPDKIFTVETDKKRKPEKHLAATAIAAPSFIKPIQKQFYSHYGTPLKFGFDYSNNGLHDSSSFHSHPALYRFKSSVMAPQYGHQYGSYSHLRPVYVNSELAAMASSNTPKSANPTKKKLYKENWYIKKTTTGGKHR